MNWRRGLLASFLLHCAIFVLLFSGIDWSLRKAEVNLKPIEAHLVVKKKQEKPELLPRKLKEPVAQPNDSLPKEDKKVDPPKETAFPITPPLKSEPAKVSAKKAENASKKSSKYVNKLSSLSQMFAKDLAAEEEVPLEGELVDDSFYFDQVYTLIKESFVVPPHLQGPKGETLRAVLRIFLAADGGLLKLDLELPSGDEHFDKAVLDGTKRVNNFGAVPIFLQGSLRERGIVVELCPVKCQDR